MSQRFRGAQFFPERRVSSLSVRHPTNTDQVMQSVEPSRQFVKDSMWLVKRCTKPGNKEFQKIAMATAIGFAIMGSLASW
jgi:protein transport protein SEC61 subunit gamma-like protein